jgi:hypothetical protein
LALEDARHRGPAAVNDLLSPPGSQVLFDLDNASSRAWRIPIWVDSAHARRRFIGTVARILGSRALRKMPS